MFQPIRKKAHRNPATTAIVTPDYFALSGRRVKIRVKICPLASSFVTGCPLAGELLQRCYWPLSHTPARNGHRREARLGFLVA
jgi:hypothetical protein